MSTPISNRMIQAAVFDRDAFLRLADAMRENLRRGAFTAAGGPLDPKRLVPSDRQLDDLQIRLNLALQKPPLEKCPDCLGFGSVQDGGMFSQSLPGGADVAEMRGLLVRCFEHLGREIDRKSLADSALDGTQVLSRQVAEFLDRTGVVVSTPDDLDSKTDTEINGLFAVEVAGLVRTESGAFRSKPGAATIAFVTPDMLDYCEIAEEVLPFASSWRSLYSPGDGYSVTVYGGPGLATARNSSFPRALAVALIRLARLPR